jgi:FKBP-type peptidyl-prolyl cis-trans isomerase SlpA
MTARHIGPNTRVTLHFEIQLEDGQIVDTNFGAKPAEFTVGDGNLLEGFEQVLFGLHAGDEQTFTLAPEKAFGMPNPSNIQRIARSQFGEMELEEGLVISFADPGQGELPGVVDKFDENHVHVNFNHPLAGEWLKFRVQILSVEIA